MLVERGFQFICPFAAALFNQVANKPLRTSATAHVNVEMKDSFLARCEFFGFQFDRTHAGAGSPDMTKAHRLPGVIFYRHVVAKVGVVLNKKRRNSESAHDGPC